MSSNWPTIFVHYNRDIITAAKAYFKTKKSTNCVRHSHEFVITEIMVTMFESLIYVIML